MKVPAGSSSLFMDVTSPGIFLESGSSFLDQGFRGVELLWGEIELGREIDNKHY